MREELLSLVKVSYITWLLESCRPGKNMSTACSDNLMLRSSGTCTCWTIQLWISSFRSKELCFGRSVALFSHCLAQINSKREGMKSNSTWSTAWNSNGWICSALWVLYQTLYKATGPQQQKKKLTDIPRFPLYSFHTNLKLAWTHFCEEDAFPFGHIHFTNVKLAKRLKKHDKCRFRHNHLCLLGKLGWYNKSGHRIFPYKANERIAGSQLQKFSKKFVLKWQVSILAGVRSREDSLQEKWYMRVFKVPNFLETCFSS